MADKVTCMYAKDPIIAPSAFRHGLEAEDIAHAYRQPIDVWTMDDGLIMLIGPDRSGRVLEIGTILESDAGPVVVHAMPARRKFLR
ncbi:MAG: hypothetical protein ACREJ0_21595 [Geminicoccaceae bacterium]